VTVCGQTLCANGSQYWINGATAYGQYGDAAGEIALAKAGNVNTLELVEFDSSYHNLNDTEAADTWNRVDAFVAAAGHAGLHVILNLSEYGQSLQAAGYTMSSAAWQGDWNQYLTFVADRVNTVSGATYKNDPTIAMVELWGEIPAPNHPGPVGTGAQMQSWYDQSMALWKSLAPNVLVSSGGFSYLNDTNSGIPWQAIMSNPNNAACDIEINSNDDRNVTTPMVTQYCRTIGKPWFLAAWSSCFAANQGTWDIDHWANDAQMAAHASDMYAVAKGGAPSAYPALGADFWNLGGGSNWGTCDVGTQFPQTWGVVHAG